MYIYSAKTYTQGMTIHYKLATLGFILVLESEPLGEKIIPGYKKMRENFIEICNKNRTIQQQDINHKAEKDAILLALEELDAGSNTGV